MSRIDSSDSLNLSNTLEECTTDLESTWKDAPRNWGHSLHRLSPYVGGFPPSLAHYFIRRFSDVGDTVLDPFCGGGTTPFEAALNNRQALGNDAFSYAYALSTAKCNPMPTGDFKTYLDAKLAEASAVDNTDMRLLEDEDLRVFYSDYTLDQLLRLREVVVDDMTDEGLYLKAIICGALHGPSDMYLSVQTKDTYAGSVNYVREYAKKNGLEKPEADVREKALRNQELAHDDLVPPWLSARTRITQGDARDLPFREGAADLVVTSPPYMRVLSYTWNNWLRLWWLGKDRKTERDKLDITQDVDKYRAFMKECLQEMDRVMGKDSVAVLIVGDVKKSLAAGERTLNTAGYIAEEALSHTDFDVHGVIEDAYDVDNRGYVVFNQLKYDYSEDEKSEKAKVPIDRCLILKKGNPNLSAVPSIDWSKEYYKQ